MPIESLRKTRCLGTRLFSEETMLELEGAHTGSSGFPPATSGPEAAQCRGMGERKAETL